MSAFGGGGTSGFSFGAGGQSQSSSGFTFGQTTSTTASKPTPGLFSGAGAASGNIFGQNTSTSQPASGFSFGSKPTGGGIFGQSTTTSQPPLGFGSKPGGSLFAAPASSSASTQPASSGFGFASGLGTQSSGFGAFGAKAAATTSAQSAGGFSFGASPSVQSIAQTQKPAGGFSFGASAFPGQQPSSTAPSGFSLGQKPATETPKAPSGFNAGGSAPFGGGTTLIGGSKPLLSTSTAPAYGFAKPAEKPLTATASVGGATSGFKLGAATATTQATPASTGGFGFGSSLTSGSSTTGGFSLTSSTTASQPSSGFTLGGTPLAVPKSTASTTTPSATFGFGLGSKLGAATTSTAPGTTTAPATTTPALATGGFSLGGKTSSSATGFGNLGASTTSTAPATTTASLSSGFKLGGGSKSFGASTAVATSTSTGPAKSASSGTLGKGFSFGTTSTAAATTSTAATTVTTSATSAAPAVATMKYSDLEAKVNSWMSELEQQEKLFLTQATHVNAWNKLLIENADKITNLNAEFENVELSQKRLTAELDYIKTQQNDLEELLKPLEEKTKQQMATLSSSVHTQHADIERERTYNLAENIDSQLKNMAQDLREVVEHINSTSTPADANNPVLQIGKILSAHMDSLQWLDSNSSSLQHKVQDMTKQVDQMKREHESKFRLAFN